MVYQLMDHTTLLMTYRRYPKSGFHQTVANIFAGKQHHTSCIHMDVQYALLECRQYGSWLTAITGTVDCKCLEKMTEEE